MDGSWVHSFGFLEGNSDLLFQFGDINNDGYLDFTCSHEFGSVYFGDGTGTFVNKDLNLPPASSIGRRGVALGDVDGNGGKDLSFVNSNGGVEVWIWDDLAGQWDDYSGELPGSGNYQMTQLCDMDLDGNMDAVAFGDGQGNVWLGDGKGSWEEDAGFVTQQSGHCEAFRVGGDVDLNGYPDIVLVAEIGNWPSDLNYLKCYKETHPVFTLAIRPVFPMGNEFFWQNCIRNIRWSSSVPAGDSSWVKLEYSVTGPAGPWYLIDENLPNNGCYQWLVPMENSLDCHIRYSVETAVQTSTGITALPFTISDGTAGAGPEKQAMPCEITAGPNPSRGTVTFSINLKQDSQAVLRIRDCQGKTVKLFSNLQGRAGFSSLTWNGTSDDGRRVPAGIYFYEFSVLAARHAGKLIISK
jgi:hypothetical protein